MIEAGINVLISIILVKSYGLYGVAIGTLSAMIYRSCYLAFYLSKAILYRPFVNFVKHIVVDALTIALIFVSTKWLIVAVNSYVEWIVMSAKLFAIAAIETAVINYLFYRHEFTDALHSVKFWEKRVRKKQTS